MITGYNTVDKEKLSVKSVHDVTIPPIFQKYDEIAQKLSNLNSENCSDVLNYLRKTIDESPKSEQESVAMYINRFIISDVKCQNKFQLSIAIKSQVVRYIHSFIDKHTEPDKSDIPNETEEPFEDNVFRLSNENLTTAVAESILQKSVQYGWVNTVKFILMNKKSYIRYFHGLASSAVAHGNFEIINAFVNSGINLDYTLRFALDLHHSDVALYLFENYKCSPDDFQHLNLFNIKWFLFALENKLISIPQEVVELLYDMDFLEGLKYLSKYQKIEKYLYDPRSAIFEATMLNQLEWVKAIFDITNYVTPKSGPECPYLGQLEKIDLEIFKLWIERHYNSEYKNCFNMPLEFLMQKAIDKDRIDIVKYLLELYKQLDYPERKQYPVLSAADKSLEYLKLFVENGVNLDDWPVYDTAADNCNTEMIEYLLELGVNPKSSKDNTLLIFAAKVGRTDLFVKFIEAGIPLEKESRHVYYSFSTLNSVAGYASREILEILVENHSNINAILENSITGATISPIDRAAHSRNAENVKFISDHGGIPYHYRSFFSGILSLDDNDLIQYCLDRFNYPREVSELHKQCLFIGGERKFDLVCSKYPISSIDGPQILSLLDKAIDNNAEYAISKIMIGMKDSYKVNQETDDSKDFIQKVVSNNSVELMSRVISAGLISINGAIINKPVLLLAAKNNNTEIASLLLENGYLDKDEKTNEMAAAVYAACIRNNYELVSLLLSHGGNRIDIDENIIQLYHIRQDILDLLRH